MPKAPVLPSESERLRALRQCCILDTAPEPVFDDLTRFAARACKTPIALVSLVDSDRQWFKSAFGLSVSQTHRDVAFCAHAIYGTGPLIVTDASVDPRTCDNPLVTEHPHFRFYAGIPLRTSDGHALGTLCVIDTVPRELTTEQLTDLESLARQASGQIELRRANFQLAEDKRSLAVAHDRLVQIAAQVPGVVYQYLLRPDGSSCFPYASDGIREIYRVSPEDVRDDATRVLESLHPDDHDDVVASIELSARTLQPWRHEYRVRFENGDIRWLCGNAMPTRLPDRSVCWHGFITDITQQRVERDESHRLRSQLEAIVDASTQVAIISTDLQGVITLFNTGAEQMLGYAAEELVGLQTPERFHLESEVLLRAGQLSRETGRQISGFDAFVEYARQGRHDSREWTYIRKDGTHLTVRLAVTAIRDCDNTLKGFLGVATDVTRARNAERELRTERERLELALTGAQLGTWDWNVQSGEKLLDARWAAIIGEPLENLRPSVDEWTSRIHPEDLPDTWQCVQDHFTGVAPICDVKFRIRHANGSWRWVVVRGRLVERDRRGRPLRMVGTMADITDQVHAENEIKAAAELLHQFIACTPAAVAMLDREMRYLRVSERWMQDYGLQSVDLIGKSHYEVFPDIPDRWKQIHQRVLEGATESCDEDRFDRSDGTAVWLQWEARPWRNSENEIGGVILFTQVITNRKQAESELVAAREAAEAANRSKSDFLANMSHEIRTPLTSILGYADVLSDDSLSDEERRFSLETIKQSGRHLLTVINDILDLSKIEAGKMTTERVSFPPAAIVEEVLSYFQEQAEAKSLSLRAVVEGSVPRRICSDPVRLRQILVNLVGNAVKFTEVGGVKVVLKMIPAGPSSQLAFEIHDSGIGIAEAQLPKLFAPFVQIDSSYTRNACGTGLGLAICKRMSRLLGGDVLVESVLGAGSVFILLIDIGPIDGIELTSSLAEDCKPILPSTPAPQLRGRILLVEDSEPNRVLLVRLLERAGAQVDSAENGQIALKMLRIARHTGREYDLLITDMQMPVMDGYTLARQLRNSQATLPIIALTAHAMTDEREKCLAAGCDECASKPIGRTELLVLCSRMMSRSKCRPDEQAIQGDARTGLATPVPADGHSESPQRAFHVEAALELVEGDVPFLRSLVTLFLKNSLMWLPEIQAAVSRGDAEDVARTAHLLRGSAANLSAKEVAEIAGTLESMVRSGRIEQVSEIVRVLENRIRALQHDMQQFLDRPDISIVKVGGNSGPV
jgi:PAS domain S-box-containing protein